MQSKAKPKIVTTTALLKEISIDRYSMIDKDFVKFAYSLLKEFFSLVITGLTDSYTYKLPMRLGFIKIEQLKRKPVDWVNSVKLRTKIIHKNYNTDGYLCRFTWKKKNTYTIFNNKSHYSFRPTRTIKRAFSKLLQTEYRQYTPTRQ